MTAKSLTPELASLIHHVELNKAGWWDHAIERFIIAALWFSEAPLTPSEIRDAIRTTFAAEVDFAGLRRQVEALKEAHTVVPIGAAKLKLSESAGRAFAAGVAEAERSVAAARERYLDLFKELDADFDPTAEWQMFNDQLLMPMIRDIGAKTYKFLAGVDFGFDAARIDSFLERYRDEQRGKIRNVILHFLDPQNAAVRDYVLRCLNTYFALEASNLSSATLDVVTRTVAARKSIVVFVDTNFLFSILGIHENPSNEAAQSLVALIADLPRNIELKLYVSPLTVDETRRVIDFHKQQLQRIRATPNMADAIAEPDLSGVAKRYLQAATAADHPIDAETYFDPYVRDLLSILRSKHVELFNAPMDGYSMRQDVVDAIVEQLEHEKKRYGARAKTYEQLLHDIALWFFVKEKRPARVEAPLDAGYWVVTVDYHFLGFDAYRNRDVAGAVPTCVHPTSLIYMLQFFVPRTKEFEDAMLSSLRWPFFLEEFGSSSEQVTLRILEALSRFENVGDLPRDVVAHVLVNQALRGRMSSVRDVEAEIKLVREALIEENGRARADLVVAQKQVQELRQELKHEATASMTAAQKAEKHLDELRQIRKQLDAAVEGLNSKTTSIEDLKKELTRQQSVRIDERTRGRFVAQGSLWLIALLIAALLTSIGTSAVHGSGRIVVALAVLFSVIWLVGFTRRIRRTPALQNWTPCQTFLRAYKWLVAACVTVFLGVVANFIYAAIKGAKY